MKIFYFGSVCSQDVFNDTVKKSRVKPSASAQSFESALVKGLSGIDGVELTVASAESIAMYPSGSRLFLKKRKDVLNEGQSANIIPTVNLPFIKQMGHAKGAAKLLRKWIKENKETQEKCVFVYGIYPSVVKSLLKICKKHNCKIFAMITDVPSTMFTYTQSKNVLKRMLSGKYRETAVNIQDRFDGYVYLTEAMKDEVAPRKNYTVVETIADTDIFNELKDVEKSRPSAVMYAGALYKKYGVDMIVDAFERTTSDCELWLFGSGDYEDEIIKRAEKNSRIRFFGRVSREEVLCREKMASLLLNIRNPDDVYTKYSFPSKMVEYMLSGTPILTTELEGIPAEYYDHCYHTTDRSLEAIACQIDKILSDGQKDSIGKKAEKFVKENKNCDVQAAKIVRFIAQQL